ncbi:MAG: hypothetical protein KatS3mg113_0499 [Planctomycetaceae bacterium]|nr:MAG: hypothetical protein KatS3mg113_0499 [Planctomycetaceae bacterium]
MPATEEYLRDIKMMHKVFCASALALLGAAIWMMWDDYADEWRVYQQQAQKHIAERDKQKLRTVTQSPEFQEQLKQLEQERQLAEQQLAQHAADISQQERVVQELAQKAAATLRELRVKRAIRDVERAQYNLTVRDNLPADIQQKELEEFNQAQKVADEYEDLYKQVDLELQQAKAKLNELTQARDEVDRRLKATTADVDRMKKAIARIEPETWLSRFKRNLLLLPILDGFNSPVKIQQDWLPRLELDLGGMTKVARFDRCRTCHYMIDAVAQGTEPGFPFGTNEPGKYPHPYASHPRLDLYLTSTSPHPLPKFGCTICHEGQGSGTSFQNASHTPNDPNILADWHEKYGWFDNHFWEHPMYPKRFVESSCVRCHINIVELGVNEKWGTTAPKLYRGYQLVKTYGCFGCHEIQGYDGTKPIGPDLRLEPATAEEAARLAQDPNQVPGKMRKVGPSLRHLASKALPGWIQHWTEEPKRFRPTTRMPQFYKLTNLQDELGQKWTPVELAGIAEYLLAKSEPLETLSPLEGYQPNAERGRELFAQKGCLACHSHPDFPGMQADFGPELSKIHAKLKPGREGFLWLYTWIREPERYHPRTRMPHLYLEPEQTGGEWIDPAADIAAYLLKLQGAPEEYQPTETYDPWPVNDEDLDSLVRTLLSRQLTQQQIDEFLTTGVYPIPREKIKTDEIELAAEVNGSLDPVEWKRRKLIYIGRKTITKYGCYGCHDIPHFEQARPIGTALQDWGKKDRSRLAFEHIHEYLHHHGQPQLGLEFETLQASDAERLGLQEVSGVRFVKLVPGLSPTPILHHGEGRPQTDRLQIDDVLLSYDGQPLATQEQLAELLRRTEPGSEIPLTIWRHGETFEAIAKVDGSFHDRLAGLSGSLAKARRGEFANPADADRELSAGFYYESLLHHGRAGFLWQKLRQPRSYDYRMIETKPYDDRLRMPKFPFSEEDIDAIATFILGLIAEPPQPEYLYYPSGARGDVIKGEQLIEQYNCGGCHMFRLPEIRYGARLDDLAASDLTQEYEEAVQLLHRLKPARNGLTGETRVVQHGGETAQLPVVSFRGLIMSHPNPDDDPEDQEYVAELWETLKIEERLLVPTTRLIFPAAALQEIRPSKGGQFAQWLAQHLVEAGKVQQLPLGMQAAPPPLDHEGIKVQTPWLYNFLKNPYQIRYTTVLRMPRFTLSDDEARNLANYFAAIDQAAYPYQRLSERETPYLAQKNAAFKQQWPDKAHDYLSESWLVLNGPLCIKCHAVGGRQPMTTDPSKDIRAPSLDGVAERLRPDWTLLWLYKPTWITPYTSMPQNFPLGKKNLEQLFDGDGNWQTVGVRDALFNYHKLMERDGRVVYEPPAPTAAIEQNVTEEEPRDASRVAQPSAEEAQQGL